jgi:hypothetical protein
MGDNLFEERLFEGNSMALRENNRNLLIESRDADNWNWMAQSRLLLQLELALRLFSDVRNNLIKSVTEIITPDVIIKFMNLCSGESSQNLPSDFFNIKFSVIFFRLLILKCGSNFDEIQVIMNRIGKMKDESQFNQDKIFGHYKLFNHIGCDMLYHYLHQVEFKFNALLFNIFHSQLSEFKNEFYFKSIPFEDIISAFSTSNDYYLKAHHLMNVLENYIQVFTDKKIDVNDKKQRIMRRSAIAFVVI